MINEDGWYDEFKKMLFPEEIFDVEVESANKLKFNNIPQILFKYREFDDEEYSLKNLEDDTVWLSDPRDFNDPYDCSLTLQSNINSLSPESVIKYAIHIKAINESDYSKLELIKNSEDPLSTLFEIIIPNDESLRLKARDVVYSKLDDIEHEALFEKSESMKSGIKVCSFSTNPCSMLMWAHYSKYHSGFCIAYDFKSLGVGHHLTRQLYPVEYSESIFDLTKIINKTMDKMISINPLYINQSALIKSKEWDYEKEWRLVFGNYLIKKSQSISVPKPKFVLLGCKISKDNESKIRRIFSDKGIEVKEVRVDARKFQIKY